LEITLDRQVVAQRCPECNADFTVVRGSVYNALERIGLYLIALHGHSSRGRLAHLAVAILDGAPDRSHPVAAAMQVIGLPHQFEVSFVDWTSSLWHGETYLGEMLDREQALASPQRSTFFHVSDHVVTELPEVQAYFASETPPPKDAIAHTNPVWRDRGDCTLRVDCELGKEDGPTRIESLWCKRMGNDRFELCCVPFMAVNLALGDQVTAIADGQGNHLIMDVPRRSQHSTFQLWFTGSVAAAERDRLAHELISMGCLLETSPSESVAIDASSEELAKAVYDLLSERARLSQLQFRLAFANWYTDQAVRHFISLKEGLQVYDAYARVSEGISPKPLEQLWCTRVDDGIFEVRVIPFFAYDLALKDQVELADDPEQKMRLLRRVVQLSGHYTFRAWFGECSDPVARNEVPKLLTQLGCLMEWYSENLVAIDATPDKWQEVADLLWEREQRGHLVYETGRQNLGV